MRHTHRQSCFPIRNSAATSQCAARRIVPRVAPVIGERGP